MVSSKQKSQTPHVTRSSSTKKAQVKSGAQSASVPCFTTYAPENLTHEQPWEQLAKSNIKVKQKSYSGVDRFQAYFDAQCLALKSTGVRGRYSFGGCEYEDRDGAEREVALLKDTASLVECRQMAFNFKRPDGRVRPGRLGLPEGVAKQNGNFHCTYPSERLDKPIYGPSRSTAVEASADYTALQAADRVSLAALTANADEIKTKSNQRDLPLGVYETTRGGYNSKFLDITTPQRKHFVPAEAIKLAALDYAAMLEHLTKYLARSRLAGISVTPQAKCNQSKGELPQHVFRIIHADDSVWYLAFFKTLDVCCRQHRTSAAAKADVDAVLSELEQFKNEL